MSKREACPQCGSRRDKRNGRIHTGKQHHKGKAWGHAFVLVPENHAITEEQRVMIERLLQERISLRGICRVIGVGLRWLLYFMGERFTAAPDHLYVQPTASTQSVILRLEAEVDELWSFVGTKVNRQWVGIAMEGHDSPNHGLPRGGSQPPELTSFVGKDSDGVSRAGPVLYGLLGGL